MTHPRTDRNQPEIVTALREAGYPVAITTRVKDGFPDLVVLIGGRVVLLEVKTASGTLTADEQAFHFQWHHAPLYVVRSPAEALAVCREVQG